MTKSSSRSQLTGAKNSWRRTLRLTSIYERRKSGKPSNSFEVCLVPFDCQGCQQYLVGLIVRAKKKSCGLAYWTHNGKWLDTRLKRMSEKFM